jgi:hypothetical protein
VELGDESEAPFQLAINMQKSGENNLELSISDWPCGLYSTSSPAHYQAYYFHRREDVQIHYSMYRPFRDTEIA